MRIIIGVICFILLMISLGIGIFVSISKFNDLKIRKKLVKFLSFYAENIHILVVAIITLLWSVIAIGFNIKSEIYNTISMILGSFVGITLLMVIANNYVKNNEE